MSLVCAFQNKGETKKIVMSTLQKIREKLRSLPFDTVSTPSAACALGASAVMPSGGPGYGLLIAGLVVGVIVTIVVVKLWMSYRDDGKPKEVKLPPADQYIAQLTEHIKKAPPMPKIQPVAPPKLAPSPYGSMFPDTDSLGEMPKPEGGMIPPGYQQPVNYAQQYGPQPVQTAQALDPGVDANDPYLTPL